MATPSYPPQGLLTNTGFLSSTQVGGLAVVAGTNMSSFPGATAPVIYTNSQSLGAPQFFPVATTTYARVGANTSTTAGYNATALVHSATFTVPSIYTCVGLLVEMDITYWFPMSSSATTGTATFTIYTTQGAGTQPVTNQAPIAGVLWKGVGSVVAAGTTQTNATVKGRMAAKITASTAALTGVYNFFVCLFGSAASISSVLQPGIVGSAGDTYTIVQGTAPSMLIVTPEFI